MCVETGLTSVVYPSVFFFSRCQRHRLEKPALFQPLQIQRHHPLENRHVPVSHGPWETLEEMQLRLVGRFDMGEGSSKEPQHRAS